MRQIAPTMFTCFLAKWREREREKKREREREREREKSIQENFGRHDRCKYSHPKAITNITGTVLRGGNITLTAAMQFTHKHIKNTLIVRQHNVYLGPIP